MRCGGLCGSWIALIKNKKVKIIKLRNYTKRPQIQISDIFVMYVDFCEGLNFILMLFFIFFSLLPYFRKSFHLNSLIKT